MVLSDGHRESTKHVDHYIVQYCGDWVQKRSRKLPIWDVMDITSCAILFCTTQVWGSVGSHLGFHA